MNRRERDDFSRYLEREGFSRFDRNSDGLAIDRDLAIFDWRGWGQIALVQASNGVLRAPDTVAHVRLHASLKGPDGAKGRAEIVKEMRTAFDRALSAWAADVAQLRPPTTDDEVYEFYWNHQEVPRGERNRWWR